MGQDITSVNEYETGVALNALANICTPDLAQDLAADTLALVTSSRPYVRKKATLVLYKIFLRFPQALRPSFPRLKEKLEDPDPSTCIVVLWSLAAVLTACSGCVGCCECDLRTRAQEPQELLAVGAGVL